MIIQFICKQCGNIFDKEEFELIQQGQSFRFCAYCGGKISIKNLDDILKDDLDKRVRNNLDRYMKELGIEGCIELIERNKDIPCARLYIDILKEKRLWRK
jgi:DNA-directed RNA polymerase subunit RPC12/RpoP